MMVCAVSACQSAISSLHYEASVNLVVLTRNLQGEY